MLKLLNANSVWHLGPELLIRWQGLHPHTKLKLITETKLLVLQLTSHEACDERKKKKMDRDKLSLRCSVLWLSCQVRSWLVLQTLMLCTLLFSLDAVCVFDLAPRQDGRWLVLKIKFLCGHDFTSPSSKRGIKPGGTISSTRRCCREKLLT